MNWMWAMLATIGGLVWLQHLGTGVLAGPSWSIDGVRSWLDHTDSTVVTFVVVRAVAIVFGWYLLVVLTLGGASRWLALPRMTTCIDRLTVPFARGLFGSVALLGVIASPPAPPRAPDTMVELAPRPVDDQITLHLVSDPPAASAPTPAPSPATPTTPEDDTTWVVEPGESFWSIAHARLTEAQGGPVSDT